VADQPVSYWRFGERAGETVAVDDMGRSSGMYEPGVLLGEPGALEGDPDTSIGFDGETGWVTMGDPALTSSFSIEVWVNLTGPATAGAPEWGGIVSYDVFHRLMISPTSGALESQFVYDDPFIATLEVTLGTWQHIVYVFDEPASEERFYLDGQPAGARAAAAPEWIGPFLVGTGQGEDYRFHGRIDELAIYAHALSPERIATR
jgi:hypothetical protein